MNIKKFNKFLKEDFLLESVINESIVYYAPPLRSTLLNIKNEYSNKLLSKNKITIGKIANHLLSLEGEDVKGTDITFINLSDDAGYFTYNTMKNVVKSVDSFYNKMDPSIPKNFYDVNIKNSMANIELSDMIYNSEMNLLSPPTNLYNGNKNQIKIGRAITILLKNKEYNVKDIENFINELKSIQDYKKSEIKIVFGDEIEYWYDKENYLNKDYCVLANSCMAEKKFFNLYTKNPETCGLVIMTHKNKLIARALLWKLNSCKDLETNKNLPIELYMDRVYYTEDHQLNIMQRFAIKNGWAMYTYSGISFDKKIIDVEMSVKVNPIRYREFPYMDTFARLNTKEWLLWNDYDRNKPNSLHLTSTRGEYEHGKRNAIQRFGQFFRRY